MNVLSEVLTAGLALLWHWVLKELRIGWNDLWSIVFQGILKAEHDYAGQTGVGPQKRAQVQKDVVDWIGQHGKLNFIQRLVVNSIVGDAIDAIVTGLNSKGKDWVAQANAVKLDIEARLPFLGGADITPPEDPNGGSAGVAVQPVTPSGNDGTGSAASTTVATPGGATTPSGHPAA